MDKLIGSAEKLMKMDQTTWARHANPWSGWSRISILPLFSLAVWSRDWIGWWALLPVAIVCIWTWLNPRLFPEPKRADNWMSQGVLGEQVWLKHRASPALDQHKTVVQVLVILGLIGALLLLGGLVLLNSTLTMSGLIITMLSKLWFLDRMVWIYHDAMKSGLLSNPKN